MSSIINAIINIVNHPVVELKNYHDSHNRVNNVGESLEEYIKDAFANTIGETNVNIRNKKISDTFSYIGNQNNPPDSIIKNGDAIEVKKIENRFSGLALNSSYPKSKLYSNSTMITEACRKCENWFEKDIIYAVGVVKNNKLSDLCFVYGIDYAASSCIYERIKNTISNGITSIPDVEFSETKELGRVNRVDPLGITYLRIRGMWHIENPLKVFNYIYTPNQNSSFNLMALINNDKYYSFDKDEVAALEYKCKNENNLKIENVDIKIPDNPAKLREAKLITFSI